MMFLEPRSVLMTEIYADSSDNFEITNGCDCISYAYFSLSFILFATGSVLTLAILEDDEFGPLSRYWLVGPLFLCLGFLIAIKTLVYLRRKRFIAFILRQRQFAQEYTQTGIENPTVNCSLTTSQSQVSLPPPPYEATVSGATAGICVPSPPPSYQQALMMTNGDAITKTSSSVKCDQT
ncbi:hypothetical protein HDE_03038 [Halotydeus destructor]|nr:hypothetical protein HDE_03038 [Halotydeus destructor]